MRGFKHRTIHGVKSTLSRTIALRDITEECGDNKFFSRNYIAQEAQIMQFLNRQADDE